MEASISPRFFVLGCLSQIVARTGKITQETNIGTCVQMDSITSLGHEFGYFKGSDLGVAGIQKCKENSNCDNMRKTNAQKQILPYFFHNACTETKKVAFFVHYRAASDNVLKMSL